MYSHPLVDVHKLGHRPPLLILYRTLYPRPRRPVPGSPFLQEPYPTSSTLDDEQEFSILSSAAGKRIGPGMQCGGPRDHVSLDRPGKKFHVHLDDSRMRDWAVRDAANVVRRDRKSGWSHAAGIRGGWNRKREIELFLFLSLFFLFLEGIFRFLGYDFSLRNVP